MAIPWWRAAACGWVRTMAPGACSDIRRTWTWAASFVSTNRMDDSCGRRRVRNWPAAARQDWPLQGICCSPLVEGERLWYVTSRGEVACLDAAGFYDGEDDGPVQDTVDLHEADTVWKFDMMAELKVSQHNMCSCSVTSWGDILFVNTSNGVDESDSLVPAPDAPVSWP